MTDVALQQQSKWIGGLAEWTVGDTAFLSVAFTWKLPEARSRAESYRNLGYKVIAGGPGLFLRSKFLADVAEYRPHFPDAVRYHNPAATFATRGCDEKCNFCIAWMMQPTFEYLPNFEPRPILCDNNLSAIEAKYQDFIIEKFQATGVPLLDANSGFEPKSFDGSVFERWLKINRGPWRFGYDTSTERDAVLPVFRMLKAAAVSPRRIRPYVMIGNEPFAECMERLHYVLGPGSETGPAKKPRGEPHVQPEIKLNALEKRPRVRFDWTPQKLTDVARWANRRIWRYAPFKEYQRSAKTERAERFDAQQGLFV